MVASFADEWNSRNVALDFDGECSVAIDLSAEFDWAYHGDVPGRRKFTADGNGDVCGELHSAHCTAVMDGLGNAAHGGRLQCLSLHGRCGLFRVSDEAEQLVSHGDQFCGQHGGLWFNVLLLRHVEFGWRGIVAVEHVFGERANAMKFMALMCLGID